MRDSFQMSVPVVRADVAAVAGALSLITVLSSHPTAFVVSGTTWGQPSTSYFINSANRDLPGPTAAAAVRAGANTWQLQTGAFQFNYAGLSSSTAATNDGTNLVLFRDASSGSAIATTYWWSSGSRILDADIIFWDQTFLFFAGSSGCSSGFYVEDIAAHEFGHALGLEHSPVTTATMFASTSYCNMANRSLDADDIAGARALYPPQILSAPTGFRIVS